MTPTRLGMGAAVLLALMLVITACGDDNLVGSTAATSPSVTATAASGGDDRGSPEGIGDLSATLSPNDCVGLAMALASSFTPSATFDSSGIDNAFEQLGATAPAVLQDDLTTMADAIGQF